MASLDTLYFDLKINDMTEEQIRAIKSRLESQLSNKVKIGADTTAMEAAINRMSELLNKGSMNRSEIAELNAITKALKEINAEVEKGNSANDKAKEKITSNAKLLEEQYTRLANAELAMQNAAKGEQTSNRFKDSISQLQILMFYLKEARGDAEKTNAVLSGSGSKSNINSALRESLASTKDLQKDRANSIKQAELENNAMVRLRATIESMSIAMLRYESASNSLGNPQSVESAIQKMREYISLAEQANKTGSGSLNFIKNNSLTMGASNIEKSITTETSLERQRQKEQALTQAQERLAQSHERAAASAAIHSNATVRLGNSMTGLVSITGDLRNQIGMLVSAYTVERLLKNVVEIGGEFDKQKLAMSAMLGSLEQADDIFNRMKNLALTSPFNFKDLSNYSRQLTAYGTEYKDLFDTTNRLADISAGLGGDMSRLVLAYSQVKAASVLRGQEMRQFTEFGVSLPDLLAKKYTEAEGKIVTAGDVIERVSKKMVSFQDVKDVLWKETDKGGKFYGMQDVLAQSTSGMASNLKDAIDTMYYDIANSNSGVIKNTIKDITELVSHWRELGAILTAGTAVYSVHRIAMAANNRMIGQGTAETLKSVMASKQEEATLLRHKALYNELSVTEKERLATVNVLTATDIKQLATSKAITSENLLRMVSSKTITATQAYQVASTLELSESERKYLVTLRALDIQIEKSKLGIFSWANAKKQALMMGNTMKTIGGDLWSGITGLFTPMNLAMTGAFIGLDMYMNAKQKQETINKANEETVKNAEDGAKNLNQFLKDNPINLTTNSGEILKQIDVYKNELLSSPVDMSYVITNIGTLHDAKQQLMEMRKEAQALKDAHDSVAASPTNAFVSAEQGTDHWFSDSFSTNLKDMANSWGDLNAQMGRTRSYEINNFLEGIKKDFPQIVSSIEKMKDATPNDKMMELFRLSKESGFGSKKPFGLVADDTDNLTESFNRYLEYTKAKGTVDLQWNDFSAEVSNNLKNRRIDINNLDQKGILIVKELANKYAESYGLAGESLKVFNLKMENTWFTTDKSMRSSSTSWKTMIDTVKSYIKGGDISKASQEETTEAVNKSMEELRTMYPQMKNYLDWMQKQLKNNPLMIYTMFREAEGQKPEGNLEKSMRSKWAKRYGYAQNLPTKWAPEDEDVDKYRASLDSNLKTAKDHLNTALKYYGKNSKEYKEALDDYNSGLMAQSVAGFGSDNIKGKYDPKKVKEPKSDEYLAIIKKRFDSLNMVDSLFNKYLGSDYGERSSLNAVRNSGMSYAKVLGDDIKNRSQYLEWYYNQMTVLINKLSSNNRKLTQKQREERIKEIDELKMKRADINTIIQKEGFDAEVKAFESSMDRLALQWDRYKRLIDSGISRKDASISIFGSDKTRTSAIADRAQELFGYMAKSGVKADINFGMTEEDATEALGGSNNPNYREFFNKWKELKKLVEDDKIQIQVDGQKAISQMQSIADNMKDAIDRALGTNVSDNPLSAKNLSEYASVNQKTGLLELTDNSKTLSPSELERSKAYVAETNQEITKLGSPLLELLPAWDDIFGKSAYKSLGELLRGLREANDIIKNANIVNDKNGKPSYFTSSFIDKEGKTQQVTGNVSELDRIKNQISTQEGDINKKNPFVGMYNSFREYQQARSDKSYWGNIAKQAEANGGTTEYIDREGKKQTITTKEAQTKQKDANDKAHDSLAKFSEALQNSVGKLQSWNSALSLLGSTVESLGGGTGISDAAGVAGGILSGASSLSALGPYGAAAGAAMGAISSIAQLHDKKLDRAIEKSKQKVQELQLAYKTIEDSMKYALGNQATNSNVETPELKSIREARTTITELKNKGKLSLFDLRNLQNAQEIIDNTSEATLKFESTGNAYQYQLDLYKQQLTEVQKQRSDEQAKKKSDASKINDYNSQIEELNTKI